MSKGLKVTDALICTFTFGKDDIPNGRYTAVLAAARRCMAQFSLPLPGISFRYMLIIDKSEFLECVQEAFEGHYHRDFVLMLPAPERNQLSEDFYANTESTLREDVGTALSVLAGRLIGEGRINKRSFNDAIIAAQRCNYYIGDDLVAKVERNLLGMCTRKLSREKRDALAAKYDKAARRLQLTPIKK